MAMYRGVEITQDSKKRTHCTIAGKANGPFRNMREARAFIDRRGFEVGDPVRVVQRVSLGKSGPGPTPWTVTEVNAKVFGLVRIAEHVTDGRKMRSQEFDTSLLMHDPAPREPRVVAKIDLTPKWSEVLGLLVHAACHATTAEARGIAMEELTRMAKLADAYVASQPKPLGEVLGATENVGSC